MSTVDEIRIRKVSLITIKYICVIKLERYNNLV
jgi:hypothetical protein